MLFFGILLAIVLLLLVSGGYVFVVACVRRKEFPWFIKEELEKTPYGKYYDCITDADKWLKSHKAEDVYIFSEDGLKLHSLWVPANDPKGTILLFHGYRSTKYVDFGVAFAYYHEMGFNLLVADQRAHGESEGRFITFGVKESRDVLSWISYHNRNHGDLPIILSGLSMGASTVMYTADEELPSNVRGIIADCGFTSPKDILATVFHKTTHLPAAPTLWITDLLARIIAGFSLKEKDTRKTLAKNKLPILLVHGKSDDFVPCSMTEDSFSHCIGPKTMLLVEGAGHGVSFLVDHVRYIDAIEKFLYECLTLKE